MTTLKLIATQLRDLEGQISIIINQQQRFYLLVITYMLV